MGKYTVKKNLKKSTTYPWEVLYECRELKPISIAIWVTEQEAKDHAGKCNDGEHGLRLQLRWNDPDTNRTVGKEFIDCAPEKVEELLGVLPLAEAVAVNASLRKRLDNITKHKVSLNKYNYYVELLAL